MFSKLKNMFENYLINRHVSFWLIVLAMVLCAVQMHPSLTSVICVLVVFGLQFAIRAVAHIEGAHKALGLTK